MSLERLREPVLVLGATSLVGRYVLPRLCDTRAVALAVSRNPPGGEADDGVRWIRGDLEGERPARFPYAATVLSLSPIWLLPEVLPALHAAGMTRLLAFSSTSVAVKHRSRLAAERQVAHRLAEAEDAVIRFCEQHGVGWTLLRPTLIYDEGRDGNVSRLARLADRWKVLPLVGRARGLRQPVHARDLAWAAMAAAASPATVGRCYDLPGGETLSYRQMVERIFLGLDRAPRILPVPGPLWRLGLALGKRWLPGANTAMGERMSQNLTFDAEPAERDFGWAPRSFHPVFQRRQPAPEA